jgi:hypothetical protein
MIQFPIQLVVARTIHHSQGLLLIELVLYSTNIKKHGLTYTTLSCIRIKEKLILLILL